MKCKWNEQQQKQPDLVIFVSHCFKTEKNEIQNEEFVFVWMLVALALFIQLLVRRWLNFKKSLNEQMKKKKIIFKINGAMKCSISFSHFYAAADALQFFKNVVSSQVESLTKPTSFLVSVVTLTSAASSPFPSPFSSLVWCAQAHNERKKKLHEMQ